MINNDLIIGGDVAHDLLMPFVARTEITLRSALRSIDPGADCKISCAPDLGFPHDVIRIAGGFPTGCLVEWQCKQPFIPIDTTVNIDTSSLFYLEDDITDAITECTFKLLQEQMESSSYIFNFHKGNHFISFGVTKNTGRPVMVIHSNEKEFKYQFNGLMPKENNWYSQDVKIHHCDDRYMRYITGNTAELFADIAKSLEEFNIIRHRFIASLLTNKYTNIINQEDHHHYYMPTRQSVAIGCFVVEPGTTVPVFSNHGKNIAMFTPGPGGNNRINNLNSHCDKVIVPHGWGKTCSSEITFSIDEHNGIFTLGGVPYEIRTLVSLGKDSRLFIRDFKSNNNEDDGFFKRIAHNCPGTVIDEIIQSKSFTKHGYTCHAVLATS